MGTEGAVRGRVGRGSLIAIAVALLLVVSPSLMVASASGRTLARPASSSRGDRVAHVAFLAPVASFLLQELAGNVFSEGFGWVLGQFGRGDGVNSQIGEIHDKLQMIDDRLSAIESATGRLRGELATGIFTGLVHQTAPLIGQINYAMDELDYIAGLSAGDTSKRARTNALLTYIHTNLLDKQHELDLRIRGLGSADGLIAAAYNAAKTNTHFWTSSTSFSVRDVLEYYQAEEARLLLLRIEYMHANPEPENGYTAHYVETQIHKVEADFKAQHALLKPEPQRNMIADTRTNLDWFTGVLFSKLTYTQARETATRVASGGFVGKDYLARGWLPATEPELRKFIEGWHGTTWIGWLNDKIGNRLTVPSDFYGVWTAGTDGKGVSPYVVFGNGRAHYWDLSRRNQVQYGVWFVRPRTSHYWY